MALIKKTLDGFPQKTEWEAIGVNGERILGELALNRIEGGFYGNLFAIFMDMTEIKHAKQKLQEREAMLTSTIDSLPFGLIVTDLISNVIEQNKTARNNWGNYKGKNVLDAPLSERGRQTWLKNLEYVKKNQIIEYVEDVRHKGNLLYLHRIMAPYIIDEEIFGVISMSINITEQKKLEQLHLESEKRAIIQRAALSELMHSRIFSSENIEMAFQKIAELITSTLSVARGSIWVLSDDGLQLQCLSLYNAITKTFDSGDLLHSDDFPAYFEAIKKENRIYAEDTFNDPRTKQLTDSHLKIHGITSLLDSGVFVSGKLIGVVSAEHIGPKRKWMPDEESFISTVAAVVAQLFEEQKRKEVEQELINYKNNLELLVSERTAQIEQLNQVLQSSNEELVTMNEELHTKNELIENQNTELQATLENLQKTQEQLVQAEKLASLGILTAGVAHEINNPLNYIKGSFIGLTTYFEKFKSREKQKTDLLLNSINVGVERISKIVTGLNQFSRNVETLDEDCDIHAIINNCLIILENKIKHKVHVVKEFSNKNLLVSGNVGNLHQVFLNIIYNALQAIISTGITKITTSTAGNNVVIRITDNGIGIEKQNISKLTDPFYTTKPPGEGTGLGLSISNSIIKDHKGSLRFISDVNKGTTVIITLPLKQ